MIELILYITKILIFVCMNDIQNQCINQMKLKHCENSKHKPIEDIGYFF